MDAEQVGAMMAGQVDTVVVAARERFADWVEEYMKGKKTDIGYVSELDKRNIERMFSEAVHTYITAELAAILSYLLYIELQNEDILKRIVPAFLEQLDNKMERVPDSMVKKTSDLGELAKRVIAAKAEKSAVVEWLLEDIEGMAMMRHLRASFNAAVLSFMGE